MKREILIIPSRYPTYYQEHNYIFVSEQAAALASYSKVNVIGCIPVSLKFILKKGLRFLGRTSYMSGNLHVNLFLVPALPFCKRWNEGIRLLINKLLFKSYYKTNKCRVVHFHTYLSARLGPWIKKKYNIPYIVTEHSSTFYNNSISKYDEDISKSVFISSSLNIAVSKTLSDVLSEKFGRPFVTISNMVDTSFFTPQVKKWINKESHFITIGNLVKVKRHELLIRAFHASFFKSKTTLTIVGSGDERDNLLKLISSLEMEDQIFLVGYKTKTQIRDLLNETKYFVLVSKNETFGVVVIEALSMGLPILLTDFGGVSLEVSSYDGCVIVKDSIEDLSLGFNQILQFDKNESLRKIAIDNYSSEIICAKLLKIYDHF
nr:glycosyltransferase [Pedobacter panaciterrae]